MKVSYSIEDDILVEFNFAMPLGAKQELSAGEFRCTLEFIKSTEVMERQNKFRLRLYRGEILIRSHTVFDYMESVEIND